MGGLLRLAGALLFVGLLFWAVHLFLNQSEPAPAPLAESPESSQPKPPQAEQARFTRVEALRIGREIGTQIGTKIGTQIGREVAQEMVAKHRAAPQEQRLALQQPRTKQRETVVHAQPQPASSTGAAAQPSAPKPPPPLPSDARITATEAANALPPPKAAGVSPANTNTPWYAAADGELRIIYAGQINDPDDKGKAIALLFTEEFGPNQDFADMLQINQDGQPLPNNWKLAANQRMLYQAGVVSGRYQVEVAADLTSAGGKRLGKRLSGTVQVN